jgi:hypothetical protein
MAATLWAWWRRIVELHFDKLLLVSLIGTSVSLAALGDIFAVAGHWKFAQNWVSREWLREQTALLIGALLGLMRGDATHSKGDDTHG